MDNTCSFCLLRLDPGSGLWSFNRWHGSFSKSFSPYSIPGYWIGPGVKLDLTYSLGMYSLVGSLLVKFYWVIMSHLNLHMVFWVSIGG